MNFVTYFSDNILLYSIGVATVSISYYLYKKSHKLSNLKIAYHLTKELVKSKYGHSSSNFTLNKNMKSASITYHRNGQEYLLHIPYRRILISKITSSKIYGVKRVTESKDLSGNIVVKDENQINLDYTLLCHPPGIPFLASANDLGYDYILVITKSNDETIETIYNNDEIPKF